MLRVKYITYVTKLILIKTFNNVLQLQRFVMKIHFRAEAQISALTEEKNVIYALIVTTDLTKKIAVNNKFLLKITMIFILV